MNQCENCQQEHLGSYGSGRFCSSKCARGFSTKIKRKEINLKVSQKVSGIDSHTGQPALIHRKECPICKQEFIAKKKSKKYCDKKCQSKYERSDEYKDKMSKMMINRIIENKHPQFGKSIKCIFTFRNSEIRCDSKLEYSALQYFIENYKVKQIERCTFYIQYIDHKGNSRNFIPDFIISCEDEIYVVECKHEKLGEKLRTKWIDYIENSKIKKNKLEQYCCELNIKSFWYTNKTSKLYKQIKSESLILNQ